MLWRNHYTYTPVYPEVFCRSMDIKINPHISASTSGTHGNNKYINVPVLWFINLWKLGDYALSDLNQSKWLKCAVVFSISLNFSLVWPINNYCPIDTTLLADSKIAKFEVIDSLIFLSCVDCIKQYLKQIVPTRISIVGKNSGTHVKFYVIEVPSLTWLTRSSSWMVFLLLGYINILGKPL